VSTLSRLHRVKRQRNRERQVTVQHTVDRLIAIPVTVPAIRPISSGKETAMTTINGLDPTTISPHMEIMEIPTKNSNFRFLNYSFHVNLRTCT
jgi:hypothetical protein